MTASGNRLTGTKLFVTDAAVADFIIVAARDGVYAVDAKAAGLRVEPMKGMDLARKIYSVEFNGTPAEKLGDTSRLASALDVAAAALCAEMVGGMQRALEFTVAYAKTRKQFGKPIGIFQAVQHLCADMYLETESSRSATYYAAWALEENVPDAAAAVSVAKMYASDASRTVGNPSSRCTAAWVSPGRTISTSTIGGPRLQKPCWVTQRSIGNALPDW